MHVLGNFDILFSRQTALNINNIYRATLTSSPKPQLYSISPTSTSFIRHLFTSNCTSLFSHLHSWSRIISGLCYCYYLLLWIMYVSLAPLTVCLHFEACFHWDCFPHFSLFVKLRTLYHTLHVLKQRQRSLLNCPLEWWGWADLVNQPPDETRWGGAVGCAKGYLKARQDGGRK